MKRAFLILILFAGLVVAGCGAAFVLSFLNKRPAQEGQPVVFEVKSGSFKAIAQELQSRELITDTRKFVILGIVTGLSNKIRIGEYALKTDMLPIEVLRQITSGRSIIHNFTVPEGSNMYEIAQIVASKGLATKEELQAFFRDKIFIESLLGEPLDSLEGYLYPDTYGVTKYTGARRIIELMVTRFKEEYEGVRAGAEKIGFARNQVVTLASIVEKETGAGDERPLISSVFHNRMKKGMKLQTDPTVIYGILDKTGVMPNNITRSDLTTPTKYNTYVINGLPPGPISSPGKDALAAAVSPAKSDFIFFVSHNDGTHEFTKTLAEHNAAVTKYQRNPRAREGKSWRDLSKASEKAAKAP